MHYANFLRSRKYQVFRAIYERDIFSLVAFIPPRGAFRTEDDDITATFLPFYIYMQLHFNYLSLVSNVAAITCNIEITGSLNATRNIVNSPIQQCSSIRSEYE